MPRHRLPGVPLPSALGSLKEPWGRSRSCGCCVAPREGAGGAGDGGQGDTSVGTAPRGAGGAERVTALPNVWVQSCQQLPGAGRKVPGVASHP